MSLTQKTHPKSTEIHHIYNIIHQYYKIFFVIHKKSELDIIKFGHHIYKIQIIITEYDSPFKHLNYILKSQCNVHLQINSL